MKRIKEGVARVLKAPFLRHFAVLLSGSVAAQLLPVILSPVLSRLYTPAQFGEYALFVSGVNILSQLVCLKYDFAILTAKTHEEAAVLLRLCLVLSAGLALLLAALLPLARLMFLSWGDDLGWLYLLPCGAFFTGMFSALSYYATRLGLYSRITSANILRCVVMLAAQLLLCRVWLSAAGLSLGQAVGYAASCLVLWHAVYSTAAEKWYKIRLRTVAHGYNMFPKYTLPGAFCNTLAFGSITFFLAAFYTPTQLGYYSLVNRILSAPLALVSSTVGQVYTKELTEAKKINGGAHTLFWRISLVLTALALPAFLLLFAVAPTFIALIFGEEWAGAAAILRLLLPMVALRSIVSPISTSGIVLGRQLPTMLWQVALLLAAIAPAVVNVVFPLSLGGYLGLQSILLSLCYIIFYFYCAVCVKKAVHIP